MRFPSGQTDFLRRYAQYLRGDREALTRGLHAAPKLTRTASPQSVWDVKNKRFVPARQPVA